MVKYSNIKDKLRTFDLLLTRYDLPSIDLIVEYIYTFTIELGQLLASKSTSHCHHQVDDAYKFAHCSLIVRPEDLNIKGLNPNHIYMITIDAEHKIVDHKYGKFYGVYPNKNLKLYVHLKDLDLYMKNKLTATKLYVAPMRNEIFYSVYDSRDSKILKQKLTKLFLEYQGRNYNNDKIDNLAIIFPILQKSNKSVDKKKKVICPEFVGIVLREMGFLPKDMDVRYLMSIDFIGYRKKIPCLFGKTVKIE